MTDTPTPTPTHVATEGATVESMPTTTDTPAAAAHTPVRKFRCPDPAWEMFLTNAKARGTTGSAVLVDRVRSYNAECEANPVNQP